MIEKGLKGEMHLTVTEKNTASALGSGLLPVFATPAMIAAMENTCSASVQAYLEDGQTSVGTLVNVRHVRASGIGATIKIESELIDIDRRRLVFNVTAYDEKGIIGEGTHERFIIESEKFLAKVQV